MELRTAQHTVKVNGTSYRCTLNMHHFIPLPSQVCCMVLYCCHCTVLVFDFCTLKKYITFQKKNTCIFTTRYLKSGIFVYFCLFYLPLSLQLWFLPITWKVNQPTLGQSARFKRFLVGKLLVVRFSQCLVLYSAMQKHMYWRGQIIRSFVWSPRLFPPEIWLIDWLI